MKKICLYFEIHQIIHLKRYRFFDIGRDHYYYDDYENERSINDIAERSYVPALTALIEMAKKNDNFKVALSLSGVGLEQLEFHAPQVIDLLQELNATGKVEFLCEPYSHGLGSLGNEESFRSEVMRMSKKIEELFGQTPKVFRNSSLIYSDDIGARVAEMGFKGMITEGAKHILGWKSPHFIYECALDPRLKLILRDYKLSDDLSLRFNDSSWEEYPLYADRYMDWIAGLPEGDNFVNIFMELCAFGIFQPLSSNILEFLKALPTLAAERGVGFAFPSELCEEDSVGPLEVPYNISWVDEERDTSCWLGNHLQKEAFNKLYSVAERVMICPDRRLKMDWDYLQASNNFRFMCTKPGYWNFNRGIYDGPYDAFTNYMNILGDFITRVNNLYGGAENEEINSLITMIQNQGDEISAKDKEIERLQKILAKYNPVEEAKPSVVDSTAKKVDAKEKKAPVKKAPAKKVAKVEDINAPKKAPVKKNTKK